MGRILTTKTEGEGEPGQLRTDRHPEEAVPCLPPRTQISPRIEGPERWEMGVPMRWQRGLVESAAKERSDPRFLLHLRWPSPCATRGRAPHRKQEDGGACVLNDGAQSASTQCSHVPAQLLPQGPPSHGQLLPQHCLPRYPAHMTPGQALLLGQPAKDSLPPGALLVSRTWASRAQRRRGAGGAPRKSKIGRAPGQCACLEVRLTDLYEGDRRAAKGGMETFTKCWKSQLHEKGNS